MEYKSKNILSLEKKIDNEYDITKLDDKYDKYHIMEKQNYHCKLITAVSFKYGTLKRMIIVFV